MKTKYLLIVASSLIFISCDDNSTNPNDETNTTSIQINMNHMFGNSEVLADESMHTNSSGNRIRFSKLHYLMTNFTLVKTDGEKITLDSASAYINLSEGLTTFNIADVPTGNFSELNFVLGVDSVTNKQNPNTFSARSPLNPIINNLYWDWVDGFIFCSVEGLHFDDNDNQLGVFAYHVGKNENIMQINIQEEYEINNDGTLELVFDLSAYFESPHIINITENAPITHSDKAADFGLSNKLSENLLNAFKIKGN